MFGVVLAPGYPVARWLNDAEVDREERAYLRAQLTKIPFAGPLTVETRLGDMDFHCGGSRANGLGAAYLMDALPISLRSEERWTRNTVELDVSRLERDEVRIDRVEIPHVSCPAHVTDHSNWIDQRVRECVRDGDDLWRSRGERWPSLIFCEDVRRQVEGLTESNPLLRGVVRRLFEFERYCSGWTSGGFDKDGLPSKVSPESAATLAQHGDERTFDLPDGRRLVFSWHARLTPFAWRIHLFPDASARRIIIGYVGAHLPTVNDPT